MNKLPIIICAVCLSACTLGPDFEPPKVTPPETFVSQEVLDLLSQTTADDALPADWWHGFDDTMLNTLVKQGLAHNFTIAAAAARVEQAKAGVLRADSADELQSSVSVDSDISEREDIGDNTSASADSVAGALGAFLTLDVFGGIARSVEASQANLDASKAALRGVILGVSADITSEYLRLRGNQRQLELLRESVALQEKTMSIVRSRFKTGLAPDLDLQRAITTVENLRARIPTLERALQNSRNRIASLTGQFPGVYEATLKKQDDIPVYKRAIPALFPQSVLRSRPDVQQAEARLHQAMAEIGIAEAQYYPAFQLAGQLSIGSNGLSGVPSTEIVIGTIGGMIEQFVTDGGLRDANFAAAKARTDEALANYEQIVRGAVEEVENSLTALRASSQRQESLKKAVAASQRSFSQAETLYQQGLISFLNVVDAQRVLADALQTLAAERTSYATEIANLFNVLGTKIAAQE